MHNISRLKELHLKQVECLRMMEGEKNIVIIESLASIYTECATEALFITMENEILQSVFGGKKEDAQC